MILLFLLFVIVGVIPFAVILFSLYVLVWAVALVIAGVLTVYGHFYKRATGRDIMVRVPGSGMGNHPLEVWMKRKGLIRLG